MKKNVQRILSGILAALILSVAAFPAGAASTGSPLYDAVDFYSYVYGIYKGWREGHPDTDYSQYPGFRGGGFGSDPDRVGGGSFSKDESKAAYDTYVTTLPAQGYNSSGGLLWSPSYAGVCVRSYSSNYSPSYYCPHTSEYLGMEESSQLSRLESFSYSCGCTGNGHFQISLIDPSSSASAQCSFFEYYFLGVAPVSGTYKLLSTPGGQASWGRNGYGSGVKSKDFVEEDSSFYMQSASIKTSLSIYLGDRYTRFSVLSADCNLPVYSVVPSASLSDTTYNTTTRPTSITGGNYGIVGDNNQITKVEDNSSIVNETNNTYYNPATGQTAPITNWSYDYSDRSYKLTLDGGKTSNVTYGDENITITETTVNESGDTITNNYTIYYLIDGGGSENPPSTCEHAWTETSSTAPTCTVPGSKLLTCSKCQQTKKEAIPALGHDWQVKQTVTTEYDETGQLTQQGYTIFECSRCHEQYKSTDGTIPPGGGSGTDPGEEGETTIGGLIEKLLSGVGSIVGGIIKGLLSLLTKAVEALAGLAELFTTFVGSLVDLWSGFTSFLSAVFPFLPEEFVIIIELGLILVIAAAAFRKFIS